MSRTSSGLADLMEHDGVYGEVFNIGSQDEVEILALAEKVREATGSSSEIKLVPYDEAYEEGFEDMQRRIPDTGIRERIGWEPGIPRRDPRRRRRRALA